MASTWTILGLLWSVKRSWKLNEKRSGTLLMRTFVRSCRPQDLWVALWNFLNMKALKEEGWMVKFHCMCYEPVPSLHKESTASDAQYSWLYSTHSLHKHNYCLLSYCLLQTSLICTTVHMYANTLEGTLVHDKYVYILEIILRSTPANVHVMGKPCSCM